MKTYKILSLDGGGSWSILQLLTLEERYKEEIPKLNGHAILKQFDMVIANSGGSLVLAALVADWTIEDALDLFKDTQTIKRIFARNSFKETFWPVTLSRPLFSIGPKYSTSKKMDAFKDLFKCIHNITMDKLPKHVGNHDLKLIICTFDALNNRTKFFRSYLNNGNKQEFITLTQAIHGSSNAPVQYFDFPAEINHEGYKYYLWDGALGGFNNPVVAGVIEAFRSGVDKETISIVSIGTGNVLMSQKEKDNFREVFSIALKEKDKKFWFWRYKYQFQYFIKTIMNQAKTILFQPPDWANYVAFMFLLKSIGEEEKVESKFVRLSPLIYYENNRTDKKIRELVDKLSTMDMDLIKAEDIDAVKNCFRMWKEGKIKNQPIDFTIERDYKIICKIGDISFKEGILKWKKLDKTD